MPRELFRPGQSGNPEGRPKGSKHKLTEAFWKDLHAAWLEHGAEALMKVAKKEPAKFIAVAAHVLPKDIEITNTHFVVVVPQQSESVDEWLEQTRARHQRMLPSPGSLSPDRSSTS